MKEDFRVKYIRTINNILEDDKKNDHKMLTDKDSSNLNQCIGCLYVYIKHDGEMTGELAEELDLLHLWEEFV